MISLTNCYKWYLGAANGRNFRWREYIDGRMNLISLHTFLAFFCSEKTSFTLFSVYDYHRLSIPLPSSLIFSSKFNIPIYQFQNELRDPRQQIGTENAYNLLAIICLQEKVGPNLPNPYLTETCVRRGRIITISPNIES